MCKKWQSCTFHIHIKKKEPGHSRVASHNVFHILLSLAVKTMVLGCGLCKRSCVWIWGTPIYFNFHFLYCLMYIVGPPAKSSFWNIWRVLLYWVPLSTDSLFYFMYLFYKFTSIKSPHLWKGETKNFRLIRSVVFLLIEDHRNHSWAYFRIWKFEYVQIDKEFSTNKKCSFSAYRRS